MPDPSPYDPTAAESGLQQVIEHPLSSSQINQLWTDVVMPWWERLWTHAVEDGLVDDFIAKIQEAVQYHHARPEDPTRLARMAPLVAQAARFLDAAAHRARCMASRDQARAALDDVQQNAAIMRCRISELRALLDAVQRGDVLMSDGSTDV